ncbi:hypothetical protein BN946_scf184999.g25 [Trametes cinnabarina]|uniref:Uncharacterized protein n=1 Tax=Pycnoporus cinnabarinus TaxID=5643 RepID=A0A060S7Q7_PYCCI|nr:hypothetical protein BN946_scf184999.g25 [Trametes cinnabarina]
MAFAPSMHGTFSAGSGTQSSFFSDTSFVDISEESARKIASMQAKLDKKLGPEYISQRPGPGGGPKLTYAEGWKIINLANEVFGFNGWSSHVVSITTDFVDYSEETRRYNVGVTAIVRVTLRDGVFHEDVGYGLLENSKSKGAALDKCKKEAVTDAVKRTLRNFGNLLGNCLYDKSYTQEVVKIKVPPPKFDRSELHRRPEYEETKPNIPPTAQSSTSGGISGASTMATGSSNDTIKSEPAYTMPPPAHVPSNTMNEGYPQDVHLNGGLKARPNSLATPTARDKAPAPPTGLQTPMHTPAGRPAQVSGGDRMAQNVAHRHAARLRQIQEAQEAQRREDEAARKAQATSAEGKPSEGRAVRFMAPSAEANTTSAPTLDPGSHGTMSHTVVGPSSGPQVQTRTSPPQVVALCSSDTAPDADVDEYHFPSEDDAFLASLDLEALDEGIGRPIDFDEGAKPDVYNSVDISTENESIVGTRIHQVEQSGPAAPSSMRDGLARGHDPPAQTTSGMLGERPRIPSMGGGFNLPSGVNTSINALLGGQPQNQHGHSGSRSGVSATDHSAGRNSALKRTADIMQYVSISLFNVTLS